MHRHGYQGRKFGRAAGPRRALLRGLATSLVLHEAVTTTEAKAKELRPVIDRLITQAKRGDVANRRRVSGYLYGETAVRKLFEETGPYYADRPGGFTRLTRLGVRKGDSSQMVKIELVDYRPLPQKKAQPEAVSTASDAPSETATTPPKKEVKKRATKAEATA